MENSKVSNRFGTNVPFPTFTRPSLEALIDIVSKAFGLSSQQLKSGSRRKAIVDARSVLAHVAIRNHGYKGIEVAEAMCMSSPTVSRIMECGKNILLCRETNIPDKIRRSFLSDED